MKLSSAVVPFVLLAPLALACEDKSVSSAGPAGAAASSASATAAEEVKLPPAPPVPETPLGLNALPEVAANPTTPEKVWLGSLLFFDKRLSKDGKYACESCHFQDKGWTDAQQFSTKDDGKANTRNTPSLYNVAYQSTWYWDGRSPTLEAQIAAAWKGQMSADPPNTAQAIGQVPLYKAAFQKVFGAPPTADNIPQALAAFVRTLRSGNAAWDKYEKGDKTAVSADAISGQALFTGKARCAQCHAPPLYYDTLFHNVGVGYGADGGPADVGRNKVTSDPKDMGAFKTPGLRTVTKTGPYFHDGSVAKLEDVVKLMGTGVKNPNLDAKLATPVKLTDKEVGQIVEFLKTLESNEKFEKPAVP
jgi:cytochrome c peroxidase